MTQEQKKERNNQSKQHIDYLRLERKRKGTETGTSISRFLFQKSKNDKMTKFHLDFQLKKKNKEIN